MKQILSAIAIAIIYFSLGIAATSTANCTTDTECNCTSDCLGDMPTDEYQPLIDAHERGK